MTSDETVRVSGTKPALARSPEKAIEKQLEWAAASSSSGLVRPSAVSVRDAQVMGNPPKAPLDSASTSPEPVISSPVQIDVARRVAAMKSSLRCYVCMVARTAIPGETGRRTMRWDGRQTAKSPPFSVSPTWIGLDWAHSHRAASLGPGR